MYPTEPAPRSRIQRIGFDRLIEKLRRAVEIVALISHDASVIQLRRNDIGIDDDRDMAIVLDGNTAQNLGRDRSTFDLQNIRRDRPNRVLRQFPVPNFGKTFDIDARLFACGTIQR